MRVLIAPDKFKGTLTGLEAAQAMSLGVLQVYPEAQVTLLPVADGGEGTLEAALAVGAEKREIRVRGPEDTEVMAVWALLPGPHGSTAVIETARASGLALVEPSVQTALRTHSFGSGQLIAEALAAGVNEIVLGIGGSAMTDGGSGALRALGLKVYDDAGAELPLGGAALARAHRIDTSGLDPRLAEVKLRIAADVDNPLYGPDGAAHVFGRQKGADESARRLLDEALEHWAALIRDATGADVQVAGAGAAGGFPASFLAFTNAVLERGFDLVAAILGLDEALDRADLVITGEGSFDVQSLSGKAPIGVAHRARDRGLPVVALAGRMELTPEQLAGHGIVSAASLTEAAGSSEAAMADAGGWLTRATAQALLGA